MKAEILIVEDERIVALDLKNALTKLGYNVCGIASRADEALNYCTEKNPHLVLMDIRIKGDEDGICAAGRIKEEFAIPVIYLTAHADPTTLERARITEPFGYILKPFELVELRVAIELALYKKYGTLSQDESEIVQSPEKSDLLPVLQSIPELSSVRAKSLQLLLHCAKVEEVKAGEVLVFEGDKRNSGFLTIEGRVALFKSSVSGRELIVELLNPLDLFGLAIAMEEQPYSFSARAQVDSKVLAIPKHSLAALLEREHALYRTFISLISARLARAHNTSRSFAHDKVDIRIISALLATLPQSPDSDEGIVHITRKELAEISGTTVETAIRVTKTMERDGLLDLSKNGRIRITEIEQLENVLESAD